MILKSCEKLEKSEAKLTIQVEAAEFEAAVEKAYLKERKKIRKINVPGFRPGKAPRKMIENAYGEGVFYEDAVESSWAPAFMQAVAWQLIPRWMPTSWLVCRNPVMPQPWAILWSLAFRMGRLLLRILMSAVHSSSRNRVCVSRVSRLN